MAVNDVNARAADSAAREHFMMLLPRRGRLAGPLGRKPIMPGDTRRAGASLRSAKISEGSAPCEGNITACPRHRARDGRRLQRVWCALFRRGVFFLMAPGRRARGGVGGARWLRPVAVGGV